MKRLVLLFGLVGFIGCFLPLWGDLSWFDLRHLEPGWTVYLVIAAFAAPAIVGMSKEPMRRNDALGSAGAFGYILYVVHSDLWRMIVASRIGGRMMAVSAVLGCAAALIAAATARKPAA
jgi:hypothetical protein